MAEIVVFANNMTRHISLDEAIVVAERHLNETVRKPQDSVPGDFWVVSRENVTDLGDYWLMHYQSALYLQTGSLSYLLAGNLPLRISKAGIIMD
jgi:hypothetical protein